jgi:uncharacterized protein (DUF4415 family)
VLKCLYNGGISVKKKRKAKIRRSGTVATIRASAVGGKRSRDLPPGLSGLYRPVKKPVTLRLDADILEWFKEKGRGYQTRINRALREMMVEGRELG